MWEIAECGEIARCGKTASIGIEWSKTTTSHPKVLLLKFDPILIQHRDELFAEIALRVMDLLIADILHNRANSRARNAEYTEPLLPAEIDLGPLAHPPGRIRFNESHRVGRANGRRQRYQHMNVIVDAVYYQRNPFELLYQGAEVGEEFGADRFGDQRGPILGAEYDVVEEVAVCVGHWGCLVDDAAVFDGSD